MSPAAVFDLAHEPRLAPPNALIGSGRQHFAEAWFGGKNLLNIVAKRSCLIGGLACPNATRINKLFTITIAERNRADRPAGRGRWNVTQDHELLSLVALALQPVLAATRPVGQILTLGCDAFEPKPVWVLEHSGPVLFEVLAEPYCRVGGQPAEQLLEQTLALDR